MKRKQIVEIMYESQGHNIKYADKYGNEYTGYSDVFETAYDNQFDEGCHGASICVDRSDGCGVILYENEIKKIEIID